MTADYLKKYKDGFNSRLKNNETVSVLFSGVGGQGILLATAITAKACLLEGYDVKVSEVHGMAQRGGSVTGSVRFGKKVFSPIPDDADFIISLEEVETLRYPDSFKKNSIVIYNTYRLYPATIYSSNVSYPENTRQRLSGLVDGVFPVDAFETARCQGSHKAMNTVLLGFFSNFLTISKKKWKKAIQDLVSSKILDINLKAFDAGRELINIFFGGSICQ